METTLLLGAMRRLLQELASSRQPFFNTDQIIFMLNDLRYKAEAKVSPSQVAIVTEPSDDDPSLYLAVLCAGELINFRYNNAEGSFDAQNGFGNDAFRSHHGHPILSIMFLDGRMHMTYDPECLFATDGMKLVRKNSFKLSQESSYRVSYKLFQEDLVASRPLYYDGQAREMYADSRYLYVKTFRRTQSDLIYLHALDNVDAPANYKIDLDKFDPKACTFIKMSKVFAHSCEQSNQAQRAMSFAGLTRNNELALFKEVNGKRQYNMVVKMCNPSYKLIDIIPIFDYADGEYCVLHQNYVGHKSNKRCSILQLCELFKGNSKFGTLYTRVFSYYVIEVVYFNDFIYIYANFGYIYSVSVIGVDGSRPLRYFISLHDNPTNFDGDHKMSVSDDAIALTKNGASFGSVRNITKRDGRLNCYLCDDCMVRVPKDQRKFHLETNHNTIFKNMEFTLGRLQLSKDQQ